MIGHSKKPVYSLNLKNYTIILTITINSIVTNVPNYLHYVEHIKKYSLILVLITYNLYLFLQYNYCNIIIVQACLYTYKLIVAFHVIFQELIIYSTCYNINTIVNPKHSYKTRNVMKYS